MSDLEHISAQVVERVKERMANRSVLEAIISCQPAAYVRSADAAAAICHALGIDGSTSLAGLQRALAIAAAVDNTRPLSGDPDGIQQLVHNRIFERLRAVE